MRTRAIRSAVVGGLVAGGLVLTSASASWAHQECADGTPVMGDPLVECEGNGGHTAATTTTVAPAPPGTRPGVTGTVPPRPRPTTKPDRPAPPTPVRVRPAYTG